MRRVPRAVSDLFKKGFYHPQPKWVLWLTIGCSLALTAIVVLPSEPSKKPLPEIELIRAVKLPSPFPLTAEPHPSWERQAELESAIRQGLAQQYLRTVHAQKQVATPAPVAATALPVLDGDRFDRLAQCESGGDPTRVDASGKYRGAFQWLLSTWHSAGGSGDPINASYADQKEKAMYWATVANPSSQWPVCWPRSAG